MIVIISISCIVSCGNREKKSEERKIALIRRFVSSYEEDFQMFVTYVPVLLCCRTSMHCQPCLWPKTGQLTQWNLAFVTSCCAERISRVCPALPVELVYKYSEFGNELCQSCRLLILCLAAILLRGSLINA
uniref:Uncharacterized protein n=1 Tax=Glossina austeni TaxID=7395 RepID=A0A1A9UUU1_GLOAU